MIKIPFFVFVSILSIISLPSQAQSLNEISEFAQKICSDIPSGKFTRTEISGKIGAAAGVVAKLLSGSADLTAKQEQEIYEGIPFDKLPDQIPTVAMCQSELAKILIAKKVSFKTCRHPDFGQEGWNRSEDYTDSSGRVGGGHDQPWWCNQVSASFIQARGINSQHEVQVIRSWEESKKNLAGKVTYKYHCTIRINWDPLYTSKTDPLCGVIQ